MLNVICERRGAEYCPESVDILYDMVARNLPEGTPGEFHLYSDEPGPYRPEVIVHGIDEPRLSGLNLSLRHLIVGPLDDIAAKGFLQEEDVSFYHDGPFPAGAKVIKCLGKKPQDLKGWVKHVWKVGGGTANSLTFIANVDSEQRRQNVLSALSMPGIRWFEPIPAHQRKAILVGGGPSLESDILALRALALEGDIFAFNNVPHYLDRWGIAPDFHVLMDAHHDIKNFVSPGIRMTRYYASQCVPEVLYAAGEELTCWHAASDCLDGLDLKSPPVGGGTTAAMRGLVLSYGLGYRDFHLFGLDSSYDGDRVHAYEQHGYGAHLDVVCGDRHFRSSPQLIGQAEDFKKMAPDMIAAGCEITVYGAGLLKAIAEEMIAASNK